jgi:hypothetical protein
MQEHVCVVEALSSAEALCFVLGFFEVCRWNNRGLGRRPSRLQTSKKLKTKHKASAEERVVKDICERGDMQDCQLPENTKLGDGRGHKKLGDVEKKRKINKAPGFIIKSMCTGDI